MQVDDGFYVNEANFQCVCCDAENSFCFKVLNSKDKLSQMHETRWPEVPRVSRSKVVEESGGVRAMFTFGKTQVR